MAEKRITIITGPRDSGKTAWMTNEYNHLGGRGVIMPKVYEEGRHIGYDLMLLPSEERLRACHRKKRSQVEIFDDKYSYNTHESQWDFSDEAFAEVGEKVGVNSVWDGSVPFFIDELGSLELEGRGHSELISDLLARHRELDKSSIYISVRLNLVRELIKKFGIKYTDILFLKLKPSKKVMACKVW